VSARGGPFAPVTAGSMLLAGTKARGGSKMP